MKFGRKWVCNLIQSALKACLTDKPCCSLPRNQVPEWSASYIDYKGLKKLIKAASGAQQAGEVVDLAGGHISFEENNPFLKTYTESVS